MTIQTYLTGEQVEREFGLRRRWLARHRFNGTGPKYVKAGRRVLYRRADLEEYLAAMTVHTSAA
ncbi:helix-turn-helix domain-containing protein [Brevundimonas sp.]|uniref:helix-turn-helix transcriptional regulator n=1 Tax=Brevundimonas sp. TaxID=1871086 RepID=UPI0025FB2502|nr:helix-turn-helix domain-containing protein [Brevundimonas sp.]